MADEKRYYRRKCISCNYYSVFELVQEGDEAYEFCTHCQAKTPIKTSFADAHIEQCESWLENQGRMWPVVRSRIEVLDRPGAFVTIFGKPTEEELEYREKREKKAKQHQE